MKRFSPALTALALIGLPLLASGHGYRLGSIRIVHPWVMPMAPSIDGASGAGYLVLRNTGSQPDTLLSASTEKARKVELHTPAKEGHTLEMHPTPAIEIPASGEVRLKPGGPRLMLIGLRQPLEEGQRLPVVLQFEHAGKIIVDMFVQFGAKDSTY